MQAMTLSSAFVLFLALSVSVRLWLAARQIRHVASHRDSVPPQFAERITLQAHRRAADYTVAKVRLGILDNLLSTVVLVALTLLGGLQWLSGLWAQWLPEAPLLQQIAIVVSVVVLTSLIEVPMDAYRQFRLEAKFGFNRMTPGLFAADLLKSAALGAAIGIPLLSAVLWLMQRAGDYWWLWTWVLWTVFNVVILLVYPTLIAPLFNKFKPLEAGAVRSRVENLLHRCGFAANGLFVMDGSRRSAHGNAYFTGFGKGKRIVFFDTLLSRLDVDEIEAVLAHELGHFKKRHIVKRPGLQLRRQPGRACAPRLPVPAALVLSGARGEYRSPCRAAGGHCAPALLPRAAGVHFRAPTPFSPGSRARTSSRRTRSPLPLQTPGASPVPL
jgi:STE24 endopeptidase